MNDTDYVDVRGTWPMYCNGQLAITLVGKPHTISVEDARVVARKLLDDAVTTPTVRHQ